MEFTFVSAMIETRDMQQIDIHYYTKAGGEKKVIPVAYNVETGVDPSLQVIHCRVGLPQSEMPQWLYPQQFDLLTHVSDNMAVVDYNASRDTELRTLDSEFFRYKVYSEILFREQQRAAVRDSV